MDRNDPSMDFDQEAYEAWLAEIKSASKDGWQRIISQSVRTPTVCTSFSSSTELISCLLERVMERLTVEARERIDSIHSERDHFNSSFES